MWLLKDTSGSFKAVPELVFEQQLANRYFQVSSGYGSETF